MSQSVEQNSSSYAALRDELRGLTDAVEAGTGHLESAHRKAESILGISEDFMLFIAESGVRNSDSSLIELCQNTAAEIGAVFERAVANGEINLAELFDEKYLPIPRTDPQQMMTRFVALTDAKFRRFRRSCYRPTRGSRSARRLTGTAICRHTIGFTQSRRDRTRSGMPPTAAIEGFSATEPAFRPGAISASSSCKPIAATWAEEHSS